MFLWLLLATLPIQVAYLDSVLDSVWSQALKWSSGVAAVVKNSKRILLLSDQWGNNKSYRFQVLSTDSLCSGTRKANFESHYRFWEKFDSRLTWLLIIDFEKKQFWNKC